MQVNIKKQRFEYESDFDEGWHFSAGDFYKFPVRVGKYRCFIKRFERHPERISGWRLMEAVQAKDQPGLPRVYDIVHCQENGKPVHYLFLDYLEGGTFDELLRQGVRPDTEKLARDLLRSLASIHKNGCWFPDFCEKNIIGTKEGSYLLIDLDSAQPFSRLPDKDVFANREYWAPAFSFISQQAGLTDLVPSTLSGVLLNYLQTALLVLRIRVGITEERLPYNSSQLLEALPGLLAERAPELLPLFARLARPGAAPARPTDEELIAASIVRIARGEGIPVAGQPPAIDRFGADKTRLRNGGAFRLEWETRAAATISVYRNGKPCKKLNGKETGVDLLEDYDGRPKKVVYAISALNDHGTVSSRQLVIRVGPWLDPAIWHPTPRAVRLYTGALLLLVLIFVAAKGGPWLKHFFYSKKITVTTALLSIRPTPSAGNVHTDSLRRLDSLHTADSLRRADSLKRLAARQDSARQHRKDSLFRLDSLRKVYATRDAEDAREIDSAKKADALRRKREDSLQRVRDSIDAIRVSDSVSLEDSMYRPGVLKANRLALLFVNRSSRLLDSVVLTIGRTSDEREERVILKMVNPHTSVLIKSDLRKKDKPVVTIKSIHLAKRSPALRTPRAL